VKKVVAGLLFVCLLLATLPAVAQITLLANGTLTSSKAGSYKDLSGLNYKLENGVPANLLGGIGSGFTYVNGNTFLAIPDRGPNAVGYNSLVDDTVSYITRFHTLKIELKPNHGSGLPFTLTPQLRETTLLHAFLPLVYGSGTNYGLPSGVPPLYTWFRHYFSGRSYNFYPNRTSQDTLEARFDPECFRV
jgi:hypothetical protein